MNNIYFSFKHLMNCFHFYYLFILNLTVFIKYCLFCNFFRSFRYITLSSFIRYINYWNLQLVNNVNINKNNVSSPPSGIGDISRSCLFCLDTLVYLPVRTFKFIWRFSLSDLNVRMKVVLIARRAHFLWSRRSGAKIICIYPFKDIT